MELPEILVAPRAFFTFTVTGKEVLFVFPDREGIFADGI
jgi:hypothetical protein